MHFVQHPYVLLRPVEVIKGPARSPFVTARPASHLAIGGRIGQRATQTRRKVNVLSFVVFCIYDDVHASISGGPVAAQVRRDRR